MTSVLPPARSMASTGARREAVGLDREGLGELAATEHLDQAALGHEAVGAQHAGVDRGARVEALERVEVHHDVLHAEGVLEALRLGGTAVQRGLATLETRVDLAARTPWPLVPRPAVLPPLPPMPRPTRRREVFEPAAGLRSWIFMSGLFDFDEVVDTTRSIPRISGRSGSSTVWLIRRRPSARECAARLGLRADGGTLLRDSQRGGHELRDLGDFGLAGVALAVGTEHARGATPLRRLPRRRAISSGRRSDCRPLIVARDTLIASTSPATSPARRAHRRPRGSPGPRHRR